MLVCSLDRALYLLQLAQIFPRAAANVDPEKFVVCAQIIEAFCVAEGVNSVAL